MVGVTNGSLYVFDQNKDFLEVKKVSTQFNVSSMVPYGSSIMFLGELNGYIEVFNSITMKIVKTQHLSYQNHV